MPEYLEGSLVAHDTSFAVVVSRFNDFITQKLLDGALEALRRHAVICLGTVIRGATPHFDHVSNAVTSGTARASLDTGVPVIFGVLTTDTVEQAIERAGTKAGNKGADAALAAVEMVNLLREL